MNTTNNTTMLPASTNDFGGAVGQEAIDAMFVIINTFIIFTMQSGFGLLESGMISTKSEANVMVKNMLDVVVGGFGFWIIGYSIAFGDEKVQSGQTFTGTGLYAVDAPVDEAHILAKYFFHLAFATTSTTIVSGAVAERIQLSTYMIFVFVQSTFTYSFPAHWMWNSHGWLALNGAFDFAGASVVHMSGGAAALIAALVLGARQGRFALHDKEPYAMASPTNVILGVFFLWWGWIGFNCGSTFAVSGGMWKLSIRAGVVTMNGAIGGGLSGIMINLWMYRKRKYILDIPQFATSILGGLVSVTGGAAVFLTWHGILIGLIGGFIVNGAIVLVERLHIDDPVGCFATHWVCGFWGMIATGLFAQKPVGFDIIKEPGLFYGGSGRLLAYNVAGALSITLWSVFLTLTVFLVLKATIGIRISYDKETRGSDEVEHNIIEYVRKIETKHVFGKHLPRPKLSSFGVNLPTHVDGNKSKD